MTPPCPRQCSRAFSCVTAPDDSHSWIIHLRLSLFCAQDSLCLLGQQLGAPRHTSLPLIQVMAFGLGAGVSRHSQPGGRYPVAVGPRRSSESGTIPPALTAPPPSHLSIFLRTQGKSHTDSRLLWIKVCVCGRAGESRVSPGSVCRTQGRRPQRC